MREQIGKSENKLNIRERSMSGVITNSDESKMWVEDIIYRPTNIKPMCQFDDVLKKNSDIM